MRNIGIQDNWKTLQGGGFQEEQKRIKREEEEHRAEHKNALRRALPPPGPQPGDGPQPGEGLQPGEGPLPPLPPLPPGEGPPGMGHNHQGRHHKNPVGGGVPYNDNLVCAGELTSLELFLECIYSVCVPLMDESHKTFNSEYYKLSRRSRAAHTTNTTAIYAVYITLPNLSCFEPDLLV